MTRIKIFFFIEEYSHTFNELIKLNAEKTHDMHSRKHHLERNKIYEEDLKKQIPAVYYEQVKLPEQ